MARVVLGLSWAQHRLRGLIRLSHVKNCPFFLCEVEFLLFEFLLLYLNCVEEKKQEKEKLDYHVLNLRLLERLKLFCLSCVCVLSVT